MSGDALVLLPVVRVDALGATRARNDEELVASWLDSLRSAHSRRNFAIIAQRFLTALPMWVAHRHSGRRARCHRRRHDRRQRCTARQYALRIKSLLSYGHELGYMPFNAGVRIKVQNDAGNRGASLAKRIMTPP